jgi:hypothetical protein
MGILAYLAKGRGDMGQLAEGVRSSRMGPKFADWMVRNEGKLKAEPRLRDAETVRAVANKNRWAQNSHVDATTTRVREGVPSRQKGNTQDVPSTNSNIRPQSPNFYYPVRTKRNKAFFWSGRTNGVGGEKVARQIAEKNGGTTLEKIIEEKNIQMPAWDPTDPKIAQAWKDISAEYAQGASGTVRAVIGKDLRPGNVWETSELPSLMNNPDVEQIITIDPENGVEKIIFNRGP